MTRSADSKLAVLRALRGATGPTSTQALAAQVHLVQSVVLKYLHSLEEEGRAVRVVVRGTRGNGVRWKAAPPSPDRAKALAFLDALEEQTKADLEGVQAVRRLISHLEERLAIALGAQPLNFGDNE